MHPRVLIVGAGIAGIACAQHLSKAGITDFTILEAQNRIGGRIWSIDFDRKGNKVELGASWIHGRERNPIYTIAAENNLLQNECESKRLRHRDVVLKEDSSEPVPDEVVKDVVTIQGMIFEQTDDYYRRCIPIPERNDSVGSYIEREFKKNLEKYKQGDRHIREMIFKQRMLLECCMNGCDDLSDLSLQDIGCYQELPGMDYTILAGFEAIIEILRKDIPDENILLNRRVSKICCHQNKTMTNSDNVNFDVCVKCDNGDEYYADHVVVTLPLGVMKACAKNLFEPPLTSNILSIINRMGYGVINKIFLEFEEQVFDSDVFCIELLWDSEPDWNNEDNLKKNWFKKIYSFEVVHENGLIAWLSGKAATHMESLPEEEIGRELCEVLRHFLKKDDIPLPRRVIKTRWSTDPYSLGAYSYISIESCAADIHMLANPLYLNAASEPTVLFAGEATHRTFFSTAHGAMLTGQREAQRIIDMYTPTADDNENDGMAAPKKRKIKTK